jgi:transposase
MVATKLGVSRATGYKWLRRYRVDGMDGLTVVRSTPLGELPGRV